MNDLIFFIEGITVAGVLKLLLIIGFMVYGVFAFLMMRQIISIDNAIRTRDGFIMRLFGIANFTAVIIVLIIAIVIL